MRRGGVPTLLLVAIVASSACSGGDDGAASTTTVVVDETDRSDDLDDIVDDLGLDDELDDILARDDGNVGFSDLPRLEDVVDVPWEPATRSEELLVEIEEDGPTLQHAIDAYDLTFAEMPGATPSDLPDGDGLGATYAQLLIDSVLDRLSPEQRAVVDEFEAAVEVSGTIDLASGVIGEPTAGPAVGGVGALRATTPGPRARADYARLTPLLVRAHTDLQRHRPDLPFPATVVFEISSRQPRDAKRADMNTGAFRGNPAICRIHVFPLLLKANVDDATYLTTFAHEMMHCVQFQLAGNRLGAYPLWLLDGSAGFASFDVYQRIPSRYIFDAWWTNSRKPLSGRQYDAWALFQSYLEAGGDPYAAVVAMMTRPPQDVTGLLNASGMGQLAFVSLWSSKSLRSRQIPGGDWQTAWIGNPGTGPRDNRTPLGSRGVGTYTVVGSGAWSHQQLLVGMDDEVGLVTVVPQRGAMTTNTAGGSALIPVMSSRLLCFDEQGCLCPDGTPIGTRMAGREMIFSLAADAERPYAQAAAERWDEAAKKKYCQKKKEPKRSTHNGDPHLVTFDGLPFDVMALGEFVVARDPDGGFEVQARHEPYPLRGTGTSAVAIGSGAQRITFTGDDLADEPVLTVRVDGEEVIDRQTPVTVGEATATSLPEVPDLPDAREHWRVEWPDGSAVDVYWLNGWFMSVEADLERAARLVGLLGSSNDDFRDDLVLPDGRAFPLGLPSEIDDVFAPAWQVDEATTLFDYDGDETPATFVGPPPPPPDPPSDEVVDQCTFALGSGASPHEIGSCTYDVMATGDDSFVDAYAQEVDARLESDPNPFLDTESEPVPAGTGTEPATGVAGEVALTLEGSLYDGFSTVSDADAVGRLTGSLQIAEGAVVVVRSAVCLPDIDVLAEFTSRADGSSAEIYVCDPFDFNRTGTEGVDEMVEGENYAWVPTGGVYDIAITTSAAEPFAASVELFTDADPTIVDLEAVSNDGLEVSLSGLGDTVVLPFVADDALTLDSAGLTEACNLYLYGAGRVGEGAPWDIGYCGHGSELAISPTFGEAIPFVVFLRTDDPVDITLGPAQG